VICFSLGSSDSDSEALAQQLLELRVYRGVKTIEDARFVTEILRKAYENYTLPEPDLMAFECTPTGRSTPRPTNAKRLKPADIDIVCAIGDSITAAFGADATNLLQLFNDYRASSFSGGRSNVIDTLPGNFQTFNPQLIGFSTGTGNANSATAFLNVAVSGAISSDLAAQVENLIYKLQEYPTGGWKHISLFIGGNDLCDWCNYPDFYTPANYKENIVQALIRLKVILPNCFISLIIPPDVTLLAELTGGWCSVLRPFECSCNRDVRVKEIHRGYIQALHEIENDPRFNDQLNFFVSVQPFLEDIQIPTLPDGRYDLSYFAPDCFHFSRKAHEAAALALWNNLMEAPADKKRSWVIGEPYECPTSDQFLQ
jgi:phospholipase B1